MIKHFISFVGGCLLTLLLGGLLFFNYSDYRGDALLNGWVKILSPHLEKASLNYQNSQAIELKVSRQDFPKVQSLFFGEGGSILLKGMDNKTILFFYPKIKDGKLNWKCIATNKLDKVGNYICE